MRLVVLSLVLFGSVPGLVSAQASSTESPKPEQVPSPKKSVIPAQVIDLSEAPVEREAPALEYKHVSRSRRIGLSVLAGLGTSVLLAGVSFGLIASNTHDICCDVIPGPDTGVVIGSSVAILLNQVLTPLATFGVGRHQRGRGSYGSALLGATLGRLLGAAVMIVSAAADSQLGVLIGGAITPLLGIAGSIMGFEIWHSKKTAAQVVVSPSRLGVAF